MSGGGNKTEGGKSAKHPKEQKVSASQLGKEDIQNELGSDANRTKDNGGAIFLYKDSEIGIKQKFVFNLRYYKGAGGGAYGEPHDGLYEFAVMNETANSTKSAYGKSSSSDDSSSSVSSKSSSKQNLSELKANKTRREGQQSRPYGTINS
jgi:hypothetical protein